MDTGKGEYFPLFVGENDLSCSRDRIKTRVMLTGWRTQQRVHPPQVTCSKVNDCCEVDFILLCLYCPDLVILLVVVVLVVVDLAPSLLQDEPQRRISCSPCVLHAF